MNTRSLLNLTLAGIAILLGLVIFYRPGFEAPPVPAPITRLTADDINSIRVTRKARMPLTFVKTASGWQLENHNALPASEFQLHALLGILSARPGRSYPDDALDLAEAGLDPPLATLLLNKTLVNIGSTTPLDRQRYVHHENTVYLLNDTYQHLINADWTNFVERRLVPTGAILTGLQLPGIALAVDEEQQWQLSPAKPDSNQAELATLADRWQTANATYVRRHEGTTDGEAITLTLADNRPPINLYLIARKPELILARPDWDIQYHFPANLSNTLLGLPANDTDSEPSPRP